MSQIDYLFYCPNDAFGGLEMQMAKRTLDANNLGFKSVLALKFHTKLHDFANDLKLEVIHSEINVQYFDYKEIIRIGKFMREHKVKFCVVSITKHLSQIILARNLFSKNTKIILYQQMQSGINKKDWFHNWVYKNLDAAVVITNQMKKSLAETTIFNQNKIEVIPCGIETNKFDSNNFKKNELRTKYNLPINDFIIGYIARFDPHKDQETLLRAFRQADLPNSSLVLVGEDTLNQGGYRDKIISLSNELGINDRLIIRPFLFEVNEMMNCFDLFVIPSLSETLGLVIIEAMASSIPVIGVNSGGVPELIQNDFNGYLIEQREIPKLVSLLQMLYHDTNKIDQLGRNAHLFANKYFEYHNQTKKFFDFCKQFN